MKLRKREEREEKNIKRRDEIDSEETEKDWRDEEDWDETEEDEEDWDEEERDDDDDDDEEEEKNNWEKIEVKEGTVGVSMAGGGFRIAFHAGFMDGLTEMGIKVDRFVGTSTGAISAFFASIGIPGDEWFEEISPFWQLDFWFDSGSKLIQI